LNKIGNGIQSEIKWLIENLKLNASKIEMLNLMDLKGLLNRDRIKEYDYLCSKFEEFFNTSMVIQKNLLSMSNDIIIKAIVDDASKGEKNDSRG
jgi:hypothetical protein